MILDLGKIIITLQHHPQKEYCKISSKTTYCIFHVKSLR